MRRQIFAQQYNELITRSQHSPKSAPPCSANPPTYPPQKIDGAMLLIQQKIL